MKIAVIGYGKMGKEIEKLAIERGHQITLTADLHNISEITPARLSQCDVAAEFSSPASAFDNYLKCFEAGIPVVSGTTGWTRRLEEIRELCLGTGKAFFYASNFSIGVNLMFHMNEKLAGLMNRFENYSPGIEETHHIHKLDAPSGTAITLAEEIIKNNQRLKSWNTTGEYASDRLPVISHRLGEVFGDHKVCWESDMDRLCLEHSAKSRRGFAYGAVLAAEFIAGKTGFYTMKDLLNI